MKGFLIHRTASITLLAAFSLAISALPQMALADRLIDSSITQNGGTLTVNPAGALIISRGGHLWPELKLQNGAVANNANGLQSVIWGNLSGQTGLLSIESGSTVSTLGAPLGILGTYGDELVISGTSYLGLNADSNGIATVTGAGSQWLNEGTIFLGRSGSGTLTVSSGGFVRAPNLFLGDKAGSTGTLMVTGAGSELQTTSPLFIGIAGSGTMTVSAGAKVNTIEGFSGSSRIGANEGSGSATVTGAGSRWTNNGNLFLGGTPDNPSASGTGSLTIANGGVVEVTGATRVYSGGEVTVASGGTLITRDFERSGGGALKFNGGELRVVGGTYKQSSGSLDISNGTLTLQDEAVANHANGLQSVIVGNLSGQTGHLSVESGSTVSTLGATFLDLGTFGSETVFSTRSYLGLNAGSVGSATVTGAGSQWHNADNLIVGQSGSGTLTVSSGGLVTARQLITGNNAGSDGTVTVTGAGTQLQTLSSNLIGFSGSAAMTVSAGADVSIISNNATTGIGAASSSTGSLTVTGAGSSWTNGGSLDLGASGTGTLLVENGGTANFNNGFIGANDGSGSATVTGAGSRLTHNGFLFLGGTSINPSASGTGSLTVADGGVVEVTGTTGVYSGGQVTLASGGTLITRDFDRSGGGGLNFDGGELRIVGGTYTQSSGDLDLNNNSKFTLLDGAVSSGVNRYLFIDGGSEVLISGTGSRMDERVNVEMSNFGPGKLTVANGGSFSGGDFFYAGVFNGGTAEVTVTGAGSTLNAGGNFYIGIFGASTGIVTVSDGGTLSSESASVMKGSVTVTGPGSSWNSAFGQMGNPGHSSEVNIEAGGLLEAETFYIYSSDADGSATMSVTGAGSTVRIAADALPSQQNALFLAIGAGVDAAGVADLIVGDDGLVEVFTRTIISGVGRVILNEGGTLETHSLTNSQNGELVFNGGELRLTGGTLNLGGAFNLPSGSTFSGDGTILGDATIAGTLAPGSSTGALQITGNLVLDTAAITQMELASLSNFDRIFVDGTLTYGGTLTLSFLEGYFPTDGDTFDLFQGFTSSSGTFDNIVFMDPHYAADFDYGTGQLTITVIPEPGTAFLLGLAALATAFRRRACRSIR